MHAGVCAEHILIQAVVALNRNNVYLIAGPGKCLHLFASGMREVQGFSVALLGQLALSAFPGRSSSSGLRTFESKLVPTKIGFNSLPDWKEQFSSSNRQEFGPSSRKCEGRLHYDAV